MPPEGLIRIVTVAPETEGALDFIEKVSAPGVVVAIGHTGAVAGADPRRGYRGRAAVDPPRQRQPATAAAPEELPLGAAGRRRASCVHHRRRIPPARCSAARFRRGRRACERLVLVSDVAFLAGSAPGIGTWGDIAVEDPRRRPPEPGRHRIPRGSRPSARPLHCALHDARPARRWARRSALCTATRRACWACRQAPHRFVRRYAGLLHPFPTSNPAGLRLESRNLRDRRRGDCPPMELKSIKAGDPSGRAKENLKLYFVKNGLKGGDPIPTEHELAEGLDVSRTAVREALKSLESLGIIEVRPGSRPLPQDASTSRRSWKTFPTASTWTSTTSGTCSTCAIALEGAFLERYVGHYEPARIKELRDILDAMRRLVAEGAQRAVDDRVAHPVPSGPLPTQGNWLLLSLIRIFATIQRSADHARALSNAATCRQFIALHERWSTRSKPGTRQRPAEAPRALRGAAAAGASRLPLQPIAAAGPDPIELSKEERP